MREHLSVILAWLLAVVKAWLGWVTGSVIVAIMALGQALGWWRIGPKLYGWVVAGGFVVSAFVAWKKEYVQNRDGPDVLMEWDPSSKHADMVRLRNIGNKSALRVEILEFSWEGFSWHRSIEIQSIHPGEPESAVPGA